MKRVLWLTPKCTNVEPIIESLSHVRPTWDYEFFYYDQHSDLGWELARDRWIDKDLVIYNGIVGGKHLPSFETLNEIACPKVLLCFDASCEDWHPLLEQYKERNLFDVVVNIDGNTNWPHRDHDLTLLCPISPKYFTNKPMTKRPIHAGFCGGDGSDERRQIISGIGSLLNVRNRDEGYGTYQDYANYISKCRIILNMASTGPDDAKQVKARVIEAGMAGCCLLEQKGSPTSLYFRPMVDYLEYGSIEEAKNLIWKLGTSISVLQTYADRLNQLVLEEHGPLAFWRSVFERLKISAVASPQNAPRDPDAASASAI